MTVPRTSAGALLGSPSLGLYQDSWVAGETINAADAVYVDPVTGNVYQSSGAVWGVPACECLGFATAVKPQTLVNTNIGVALPGSIIPYATPGQTLGGNIAETGGITVASLGSTIAETGGITLKTLGSTLAITGPLSVYIAQPSQDGSPWGGSETVPVGFQVSLTATTLTGSVVPGDIITLFNGNDAYVFHVATASTAGSNVILITTVEPILQAFPNGALATYEAAGSTGGATSCELTATTLTGTAEAGDQIVIAGNVYTLTAAATAASNVLTVNVTPALQEFPAGSAVTYKANGVGPGGTTVTFAATTLTGSAQTGDTFTVGGKAYYVQAVAAAAANKVAVTVYPPMPATPAGTAATYTKAPNLAAGQVLYLDPNTPGALTNAPSPGDPNGVAMVAHDNGSILILQKAGAQVQAFGPNNQGDGLPYNH